MLLAILVSYSSQDDRNMHEHKDPSCKAMLYKDWSGYSLVYLLGSKNTSDHNL
jgi:hypothetical protein